MNSNQYVYSALLIPLLQYALKSGISRKELSEKLHLDISDLDDSDLKLTATQYRKLIQLTQDRTGNPHMGLTLGKKLAPASTGIVGYVMMNCSTLGIAIKKYMEYQKVINNAFELEVETIGDQTRVSWVSNHEPLADYQQFFIEGAFVGAKMLFKELVGHEINFTEIWFSWAQPADLSRYKEFFKAKLRFSMPQSALFFDKNHNDIPIKLPNNELLTVFEEYAKECYNKLKKQETYTDGTILILTRNINNMPTVNKIADELNIGCKTLQLRLKDEGTSYRMLKDSIRCNFAKKCLEKQQYSAIEISYLLGFSEPSVFARSFKRWTGKTPKEYQDQSLQK